MKPIMAPPYFILNLKLPDPQEAGLNIENQQFAYSLRSALDQLGARDMKGQSQIAQSLIKVDILIVQQKIQNLL